jgi:capping protein alpha
MADAGPERKFQIANYFVMSAPSGERDEVLADVNKLAGPDVMTGNKVNEMLGNYDQTNYAHYELEGGGKMLATTFGKNGDGFVSTATGEIMALDHSTRKATKTGKSVELDSKIDCYRKEIESAFQVYLSKNYKKDKVALAVYGSNDGTITICISGLSKKLSSFWSGAWKGTFSLNVKSTGSTDMTSHSKVECHYFEDGNVQLHASNEKKIPVTISADHKETATKIAEAANKFETDYQANLEEMYVDMHKETFKNMRRFLPKTKTLMNWNSTAHSLASELTK